MKLVNDRPVYESRGSGGKRYLFYASNGDWFITVIKADMEAGAAVDLATRDDGTTPLYAACAEGHAECVWLLLEAGAAVDLARPDGTTPMFAACDEGHIECAQLLSSYGASRVVQHGEWAGETAGTFFERPP